MIDYAHMVATLKKDDAQILGELSPGDCDLLHMAIGVSGEAGELLDCIKKVVIYRRPLDRANAIEELGDIEFFLEGLRQRLGITRDETIEANKAKLGLRYAQGYSNAAAQARADKLGGNNAAR
jgi:NTP pyrophosphatase (non-canonical NTP hydrolase)